MRLVAHALGTAVSLGMLVSCGQSEAPKDPRKLEFQIAYSNCVAGYSSRDWRVAVQSLQNYQSIMTGNGGFHGLLRDTNYEAAMIEARIFFIYDYLGQKSNAGHWFKSNTNQMHQYRDVMGFPSVETTEAALRTSIEKLDSGLTLGWKQGRNRP